MRIITGACPSCHQENQIELDNEPSAEHGVVVSCDHCGVTKRLSKFQKEYRRQVEQREKERRRLDQARHEAERQRVEAEGARAVKEEEAANALAIHREATTQAKSSTGSANDSHACGHCGNPCAPDAPLCPKCGHPFGGIVRSPQVGDETGSSPRVIVHPAKDVQTIEKTSKKWKAWILVGGATAILSLPVCILGTTTDMPGLSVLGGLGLVTGLIIYTGARFGAWWHHG